MSVLFNGPLLSWTDNGLFCERGGFYIDPHRAVDFAVVTHAHSDHARRGCERYLTHFRGIELLKARLGKKIKVEGIEFGKVIQIGSVKVSLHSAGHILGSAQVRVEHEGEVWVASGDYKRDADPSCEPFEVVPCDTFITEATFGTPKFTWPKNQPHGEMISTWWKERAEKNGNALLFGYSLGKAQRILAELAPHAHRPVLIHNSVEELTQCYRDQGVVLAGTRPLTDALQELKESGGSLKGELILAPPAILKEEWASSLGDYETAFASGWMQGGAGGYGGAANYDRGFVMSDHADWNDLNQTIEETGAKRVFVQHRKGVLIRHLRKKGIQAYSSDQLTREEYFKLGGQNLDLFEDLF